MLSVLQCQLVRRGLARGLVGLPGAAQHGVMFIDRHLQGVCPLAVVLSDGVVVPLIHGLGMSRAASSRLARVSSSLVVIDWLDD